MNSEIAVKITVPGFHFWKDAPEEVSFLRLNHRHLFVITAVWKVDHQDRHLEFFLMQRVLRRHLDLIYQKNEDGYQFGQRSCETIAQELVDSLNLVRCIVSEDDENMGIVYA